MRRLFLLAVTFVIVLGASLGAFLFASLWPYYSLIGKVTAGVVITGLVCIAALMIAFTFTRICTWLNHRNMFVAGEVVAYLGTNGEFVHLSAQHEAAKLPLAPPQQMIEAPKEDDVDIELILELYGKGFTYETIMTSTGASYYRVQKVCSEHKKKQLKR